MQLKVGDQVPTNLSGIRISGLESGVGACVLCGRRRSRRRGGDGGARWVRAGWVRAGWV